jgi:hypothetical protein
MVIVDAGKLKGVPLGAVVDYIAVIALTRIGSPDSCSELPSSIDLLATDCGDRPRPGALTTADTAFLQAL